MVRSEVYLNKYVVSIAPFSTPACPDCSLFVCFRFLIFFIHFSKGGQLTPFAPMCGRPWNHAAEIAAFCAFPCPTFTPYR